MRGFRQYLRENGIDLDKAFPQGTGPLGSLGQNDQDTDGLVRVARVAIQNNYDEVLKFLHDLAADPKNTEIRDELGNMNRDSLNKPYRNKRPDGKIPGGFGGDKAEVLPNSADRVDGTGGEVH